jgi:hypothetical protein
MKNSPENPARSKSPDVVVSATGGSAQAAAHPPSWCGVAAATFSPYGAGAKSMMDTPPAEVPRLLSSLELLLRNLYAPALLRSYWKGQQHHLAELADTYASGGAEPNKKTTVSTNMKSKIESATSAFGVLLTALVAIAIEIVGGKAPATAAPDTEEETETPAEKKAREAAEKKAKADAAKAKEEADLLGGDGGGEEEEEEKVTIEMLRAAGQAAIKAGKADKMKAVLKKHGAENLGGVDEDNYAVVHAALAKLA